MRERFSAIICTETMTKGEELRFKVSADIRSACPPTERIVTSCLGSSLRLRSAIRMEIADELPGVLTASAFPLRSPADWIVSETISE